MEECPGRGRAALGEHRERLSTRGRDRQRDLRQECRLITTRGRLGAQVPGQQIRAVRLEQQAVRGNLAHQWDQVSAAALVADPSCDADGEVEFQISRQLRSCAGEAMCDSTYE